MIPQLLLAAVQEHGHLAAPAQGRHLPEALRLPGQKHKVQPRMLQGKVESNQLFLTMPRPIIDRMLESYFFYFWNEDKDEIRLVTSFDTTEEDVDEFIRLLKR